MRPRSVRRPHVAPPARPGGMLGSCHDLVPVGRMARAVRGRRRRRGALTGLLFVAVSINLKQILELPTLPTRAAETLSIMIGRLLLSVFMLVPGQSDAALGAEILTLGAFLAAVLLARRLRMPRRKEDPLTWTAVPLAVVLAGTVPMVIAGISVLASAGAGFVAGRRGSTRLRRRHPERLDPPRRDHALTRPRAARRPRPTPSRPHRPARTAPAAHRPSSQRPEWRVTQARNPLVTR